MKSYTTLKAVLITAFFSSGVSAHNNYSCTQERFNAINAHFSEFRGSVLTEIEVGLDHRIGLGEDGQSQRL